MSTFQLIATSNGGQTFQSALFLVSLNGKDGNRERGLEVKVHKGLPHQGAGPSIKQRRSIFILPTKNKIKKIQRNLNLTAKKLYVSNFLSGQYFSS